MVQLVSPLVLIGLMLAAPAYAGGLKAPEGPVVLTVIGEIGATNSGDAALFDVEMLQALGEETIVTSSPWTEGATEFKGVSLTSVLEAVEAEGDTLLAVALNDYISDLPRSDADLGAILAWEVDGHRISVREKGPLWIIYPYDRSVDLATETYYARSVWQLARLEVEP